MKGLMLTGWKVEPFDKLRASVGRFKNSKVYVVMIDDGNNE